MKVLVVEDSSSMRAYLTTIIEEASVGIRVIKSYGRRPQMLQRLRCWVENFGFLFVLAIFDVVAIKSISST